MASIDYVLELAFFHLFVSGSNWPWCTRLEQASPEGGETVSWVKVGLLRGKQCCVCGKSRPPLPLVRAALLEYKHYCVLAGQACQSAPSAGRRVMGFWQIETDTTTSGLSSVPAGVGIRVGVSLMSLARVDLLGDREGCEMKEQAHQSAMGVGELEG